MREKKNAWFVKSFENVMALVSSRPGNPIKDVTVFKRGNPPEGN